MMKHLYLIAFGKAQNLFTKRKVYTKAGILVRYVFLLVSMLAFMAWPVNLLAQTRTIPAANTNTGSVNDPLGTYFGFERSAMIYTSAQIGATGNITSVGFYVNSVSSPGAATNVRIYMKMRTTLMTANTTYATEITGATLVYGPTTIPASSFIAGRWLTIPLDVPFNYTGGTDNLEVIVETNATGAGNEGSTGKQFRYSSPGNSTSYQFWNADNSAPTGNGTRSANRPNIQLHFCNASSVPTSITGTTAVCSGSSTTLTSNGGSLGTDAVDVWYSGACGTEIYTDHWSIQNYVTNQTTVNSVNGVLNVSSTGGDPWIEMYNIGSFGSLSTNRYINIRYRVISGSPGSAEIFFLSASNPGAAQARAVSGPLITGGQWQVLSLDMGTNANWTTIGNITGWRFDWAAANSVNMEFDFIELSNQPMIGSGPSITVSPTATTTYFTKKKGSCGTTACVSTTVTIRPNVPNPSSITASANPICIGDNTTLTLNDGLAVHYPFTSNLNDASGNGLNLSGSGGSISADGLSLTTSSSYTSAVSNILNTDKHIIDFEMRYDAAPDGFWRKIFGYEPAGSDRSPGLWKYENEQRLHWRYDPGNSPAVYPENPVFNTGQYYRVTGVKDGSNFSLYVDGVLVETRTVADPKAPGNAALYFGGAPVTLRNFKIYNGVVNWYSGSCGGTLVGTGPFVTVSPLANTTYFARIEGACNNSTCASIAITANSCGTPTITSISPVSACSGSGATITINGTNLGGGSVTINGISATVTLNSNTQLQVTLPAGASGTGNIEVTTTSGTASSASIPQSFTVLPLPIITTQPQNLTVCEGANGTFSVATSSGSPSYQWQYFDGSNWVATNPVPGLSGHNDPTLNLTGAPVGYNGASIRCIVTAGGCSIASNAVTLTVVTLPTGGSIATVNYCQATGSGNVTVAGVSNAVQYQWALPGGLTGSSTTSTITVTGSTPALYTVSVTPQNVVNSVTCPASSAVTGTVDVIATPGAPGTVSASNVSCTSLTLSWGTATNATGYEIQVSTASNFSNSVGAYNGSTDAGNITTTTITGLATGTTYWIRVRARNSAIPCRGAWTNLNTTSVTTTTQPVAPVLTTSASTICPGGTVSASLQTAGSGGFNCMAIYEVSTDGGTSFVPYTLGNGIVAGTQNVQFRATWGACGGSGCNAASNTYTVTVQPAITGTFVFNNPTTLGGSGILTVTSATGGSGSYQYSIDGSNYQAGTGFTTGLPAGASGNVWVRNVAAPQCPAIIGTYTIGNSPPCPIPAATAVVVPATAQCPGATVTLDAVGLAPGSGGRIGTASASNYGAVTFNGTNSFLRNTTSTGLPTGGNVTIEAWINPGAQNVANGNYSGIVAWGPRGCNNSMLLAIQPTLRLSMANFCNDFVPDWGPSVPQNQWSHVAVVVNGTTVTFFINGQQAQSGTISGPITIGAGALTIGCTDNTGRHFTGSIDNVRIWGRARTQAEIAADMYRDLPVTAVTNLAVVYRLNTSLAAEGGGTYTGALTASNVTYSLPTYYTYSWTGANPAGSNPANTTAEEVVSGALTATSNFTVTATANGCSGTSSSPAVATITPTPANNTCSSAIALTAGSSTSGSLNCATLSNPPFTSRTDVWYSFTPTCTGSFTVTLSGLPDDKDLFIYTGSCGSFTLFASSTSSGSTSEVITQTFNALTTYYIAVQDFAQTGGSFNIAVSNAAAPAQPSAITGTLNPEVGSTQTYSVTNVAGLTYAWSFPPTWTITSGQGTNSVQVTVGTQNGNISVTPTNACGANGTARTATTTIPQYRALFLSADIGGSSTWCSGTGRTVTVTVKNNGTATWTNSGADINLGVRWPAWADFHVRTDANDLAPGETRTYSFFIEARNATAGPTYGTNLAAGNNTLRFDVVYEGCFWFRTNTTSSACGSPTVGGNAEYASSNISIVDVPAQPANINGVTSATICGNSIQSFSVTNVSGVSYNWALPSGWTQLTGGNTNAITAQTNNSGGTVTVTPSNGCGSGTPRTLAVTVSGTQPANHLCANATDLPCATVNLAGSTNCTANTPHGTGYGISNYGVWYTFLGEGLPTTITSTAASGFDHEMSILSGSCGAFTQITTRDAAGSGGTESHTFTTTAGTTYYVYIAYFVTGTTTGNFTISRTVTVAPPSAITGPADVCLGTPSVQYAVVNVPGNTYNWTLPSGWSITSGSGTNQITVSPGNTSGNISVTATNSCGTSVASILPVFAQPLPIANAGPDLQIPCSGSITPVATSNNTTLFTEDFGNGTPVELTNATSAWRIFYRTGSHPANRTRWWIHNNTTNYPCLSGTSGSAIVMQDPILSNVCDYAWDDGVMDEVVYNVNPVDGRLYTNMNLSFYYVATGERSGTTVRDYFQVVYSLDNGATWITMNTGNNGPGYTFTNNNGVDNGFFSLSTTPASPNITPASGTHNADISFLAGKQFLLGFRWYNDNNGLGNYSNLLVDNIVVTGSADYSWSPLAGVTNGNTATPSITQPGTYTVTVTGGNGCTASDVVDITNTVIPATPGVSNTAPVCEGNTIDLTASGLAPGGQFATLSGNGEELSGNLLSSTTDNHTMEFWVNPAKAVVLNTEANSGISGNLPAPGDRNFAIAPLLFGGSGCTPATVGVGVCVGTNGVSVYQHGPCHFPSTLVYPTSISGWTHVAIVHNNNVPSLYINGNLVKQGLPSLYPTFPNTGTGFVYGHFNGSIDNVRVWNTARTVSEIRADMFLEAPSSAGGLIAHYPYNGNATAAVGPNNTVSGGGITFNNANYLNYAWTGPAAPTASVNETQATGLLPPGSLNYTVNASTGACAGTNSAATTAQVDAASIAANAIVADINNNLCAGSTVNLSINGGSLGDNATWQWYTASCGGTPTGSGTGITVAPTTTTTYYVRAESVRCPTTACADLAVTVTPYDITSTPILTQTGVSTSNGNCLHSDGFVYYFLDPNNTAGDADDRMMMALKHNGNNLGPVQVDIDVIGTSGAFPPAQASSPNCPGVSELFLGRTWDVTVGTQPATPVDCKFYFLDAEFTQFSADATAANALDPSYGYCYGVPTAYNDLMMTVEHTGGSLQLFNPVTINNGPLGGSREVTYALSEFSKGFLHSNGGVHSGNPLPVTLLYIEAKPVNNTHIEVLWATATEINNAGFDVQRSVDGQNWSSIGWVAGNGNTTQQHNYSIQDHQVQPNVRYYYRLKQIDFDGAYEYSPIVSAILSTAQAMGSIRVHPNPGNGQVQININSTTVNDVKFTVTDLIGRVVSEEVGTLAKGDNTFNYDWSNLASATYILTIVSANEVHSLKLAITR